jgi:hypothetical protein
MVVGDVNGDGKPDVVLANAPSNYPTSGPTYGTVTVLPGDGRGDFRPMTDGSGRPFAEAVLTVANISSLALADVNGDGRQDLVAAGKLGSVCVARNQGNGIFAVAQAYPTPTNLVKIPCAVAVGDVNGDGKPDAVVTDPRLNSVSVLLNNGTGTLGAAQTYAVGGTPTGLAVGDVSGDGKLDVVTANSNGTVSVLVGQGNGAFAAAQHYAVGGPANSVALGDFNQDGRLDVATTGDTETDVLLNNCDGILAAYQKVGPAGGTVVAADFNGDGYPDLAQVDSSNTSMAVLLNNADWAKN